MEFLHYNGSVVSENDIHSCVHTDDDTVTETIKYVDLLVSTMQEALDIANRNERSLLLECEKMRDDYDKLERLHSVNLKFDREHIRPQCSSATD